MLTMAYGEPLEPINRAALGAVMPSSKGETRARRPEDRMPPALALRYKALESAIAKFCALEERASASDLIIQAARLQAALSSFRELAAQSPKCKGPATGEAAQLLERWAVGYRPDTVDKQKKRK